MNRENEQDILYRLQSCITGHDDKERGEREEKEEEDGHDVAIYFFRQRAWLASCPIECH